jgi:hypothetical protein
MHSAEAASAELSATELSATELDTVAARAAATDELALPLELEQTPKHDGRHTGVVLFDVTVLIESVQEDSGDGSSA